MSKTIVGTNVRLCATCRHWTGRAIPDVWGNRVEADDSERAKCIGVCYADMPSMGSCHKWQKRF